MEATQSRKITFRVLHVNAIMFAKISRSNCPVCPFLVAALVSKVSGLVFHSKATGLETLNIAKKWFSETFIIQRFLFVAFTGKKNENRSEKCQNFEKN